MHARQAQHRHDDTCQDNTQGHRQGGGFDAHFQKAGRQRSRPGTGARQRDPHEQQKRQEQTAPAGFAHQLLTAPLALIQAEAEKFADVFFIRAPYQHTSCEKVDDGHRKHIADDAHQKRRHHRQLGADHSVDHGTPQLNNGHHRDQKTDEIGCQRPYPPMKIFDIIPQFPSQRNENSSGGKKTKFWTVATATFFP